MNSPEPDIVAIVPSQPRAMAIVTAFGITAIPKAMGILPIAPEAMPVWGT